MAHNEHDIEDIDTYQDFVQPVTVVDKNGDPKSLSGSSLVLYFTHLESTDPHAGDDFALKKTDGSGITINDAGNGDIEFKVTKSDWDDLPNSEIYYELWVTDADGNDDKVLKGEVKHS